MNTSSGAEYAYFMDAFGPMPAFLFSWASTLVLKPSQMAIICLSFAKYAVEAFVTECDPPDVAVKAVSVLAIGELIFVLISRRKLFREDILRITGELYLAAKTELSTEDGNAWSAFSLSFVFSFSGDTFHKLL